MQPNVGERDKLLRTILGIYAMLVGFLFIQGVVGIIVGVLGLIALVTGLVGRCGIYALFGWSTIESETTGGTAPGSDDSQGTANVDKGEAEETVK